MSSLLLLLAIPVGHLADRVRRTRLVVLSGVIAGVFSLRHRAGRIVVLLTLARFGNGVGLLANGPVHNSLLADYYPVENRRRSSATTSTRCTSARSPAPPSPACSAPLFGWRPRSSY